MKTPRKSQNDKDLKAAIASGALFYSPPDAMEASVDPLIRPICEAINQSEWVWTAESCQGHPDSTEPRSWHRNTAPFLRLVTHRDSLGRMLAALMEAQVAVERRKNEETRTTGELHILETKAMRVIPSDRPSEGWTETLIYIDAVNVYERDQAIEVWAEFSEAVNR